MPPAVVDAINHHRAAMLAREQATMADAARRWLGVEQAIQAKVDALALEMANGGPVTLGQLSRSRRYRDLMAQTHDELRKYVGYMDDRITTGQRNMVVDAIAHSHTAVQTIAADAQVTVPFNRISTEAVDNMIGLAGDGSPLRTVLNDAARTGPDAMAQELVSGIALGRNPLVVARRAMRLGLGQSFTRMQNIARTEMLRTYRTTTLESYAAGGVVIGYRRLSARDERTCPACLFADGRVYRVDEGFDAHVNCRCVTIPILSGVPMAQYETGQQWFKAQSAVTQRSMLGPGRYNAWQAGEASLDDMISRDWNDTWGGSLRTTRVRDLPGGGARWTPRAAPKPPKTPAAPQPPKPNGTPVSNALKAPTKRGAFFDVINETTQAIDSVHGDGALPQIPIKATAGERRVGVYRRETNYVTGKSRSLDIGVSTKGEHKELTFAHEIGHFIDFEQIGIQRTLGAGRALEPEVQGVFTAIRSSKAYARIDALMTGKEQLHYRNDNARTVSADIRHCQYLRQPTELWARSYAQYIAERSGNAKLIAQLRDNQAGGSAGWNYPSQWDDDDFKPIGAAIDVLFKAKGWIK